MLLAIDVLISTFEIEIGRCLHTDSSQELKKEAADRALNEKIKEVLSAEDREITPLWNEWKSHRVSGEPLITLRRSVWLLVNDFKEAKKGDHVKLSYSIPKEQEKVSVEYFKDGRVERRDFVRVWKDIFEPV